MYRNATRGGPSQDHRDLHDKFRDDRSSGSKDMLTNRQTDTQTDKLIAILRSLPGQSNNNLYKCFCFQFFYSLFF